MAYELLGELDELEGMDLGGDEIVSSSQQRSLRERGYTRDRGLLLGFGTQTGIAAGATVDFTANPQVPFRCKRPIIDSDVAPIALEDIKIGKNSQLASAGAFPASAFVAGAFDIGVKFDTAVPGIDIVVTLTNNNAGAAAITVGMFGFAAER